MKEQLQIEILFNSVEVELARRWAFGNVPVVFSRRPAMHLRVLVKAWWHIYHETYCARQFRNRQVWQRSNALPAQALDTSALASSLQEINNLLDVDALRDFRPLSNAEKASLCLLTLLTSYYNN
ncbi:hypothetical protein GCM10023189_32790 [Nibrella saemangeumensis]|uniref:Uncharacterized protein n=1 Tax=Nibrella saemangeumensis TaxID=1084526 RepID=A0ABP8N369_9BACT